MEVFGNALTVGNRILEETRLLLEKDFKKDKKIALRHLTGEGMDPQHPDLKG